MKEETIMSKTFVLTRTGLKAHAKNDNAKLESALKIAKTLPVFTDDKRNVEGRYFEAPLTIVTVNAVDLKAEYTKQKKEDEDAFFASWADGFKRQHVNRPNHIEVAAWVGLAPESKAVKAQREAEEYKAGLAARLREKGLSAADIADILNAK